MDKLSKLNGADFDKEYMSAMVMRPFPATRSSARSAHGGRVRPLYQAFEAAEEGARRTATRPRARPPSAPARPHRPTTVRRPARQARGSAPAPPASSLRAI